jgi:hypothetical protein
VKNSGNALIVTAALLGLLIFYESSLADQASTNTQPYSNGESLICSITLNGSNRSMAALFTPIDNETWIGWLWSTGHIMEPVRFDVEKSDIDGTKFVGTHGPFDIRVFVSSGNQYISIVRATNNVSESDYAAGYCGLLNEDEYALGVERTIPE